MRKWLHTLLLSLALTASAFGQHPADKKEPEPPREPPSVMVPYSLAAVGALVVILLVYVPVRRN